MPAQKKLTDASVLGCIRTFEKVGPAGPTQREIAAILDVSIATIQHDLKSLEDAGEITKSQIRGYITSTEPMKKGYK